jgi:tetratricopeptide (TPR) repeat protein
MFAQNSNSRSFFTFLNVTNQTLESGASIQNPDKADQTFDNTYKKAAQLFQKNQLSDALIEINKADALRPNQAIVENLKGSIYTQSRNFQYAESAFLAALQIDPSLSMAKFNLGEACMLQKKYPEAKKHFQEYLEQNPQHQITKYKIYLCELFNGHTTNAEKEIQTLGIVENVKEPISQYCLIARYLLEAKLKEAFQKMKEVHEKYSEDMIFLYEDSLQERGLFEKPSREQVTKIMDAQSSKQEYILSDGRRRILGNVENKYFIFYVGKGKTP